MSEKDTPTGGSGPFDQEQYGKLIYCAQNGKRREWNEWIEKERNESEIKLAGADLTNLNLKGFDLMFAHLSGANLRGANLEGALLYGANLNEADFSSWLSPTGPANLSGANLNEADLREAHLDEADLSGVYLSRANLNGAYLSRADLREAHLDEADLSEADLKYANLEGAIICNTKLLGTKCCLASVNGQTVITKCEMNEETDFTGVGLSGSRIDPKLHTQLLRNIRKKQWEKWYARFSKSQVKAVGHMLESLVVRVFWWISDYGSSTKRIIGVFFALNVIFTLIYSFIHLLPVTNLPATWSWLPMSFMQTTLIPFSITGIEMEKLSFCAMFFVMIHVISGYVILATLVTRFAVMFHDQGP